jgi:hypothetical protein
MSTRPRANYEQRRDKEALIAEGRAAGEAGLALAISHTSGDWMKIALRALDEVISRGKKFSADDVWWQLEDWDVPPPSSPSAMGGVMRHVGDRAWVLPKEKSKRPTGHNSSMITQYMPK